jgi:hypothetical protein
MHGLDQEIKGIKSQLDILIDKKIQLDISLVTAYDEEKKFALKRQVTELEEQIETLRGKLTALESRNTGQSEDQALPTDKNQIKKLIANSKLSEALQALEAITKGSDQNDVLLLQARLSALNRNFNNGIISQGDANLERARISNSALDLCDR